MHISAGAIIRNNKGDILMHDRRFYAPGWAAAAGHMDAGETPEQAMIREVKEETNLDAIKYKLLFHEFIDWNDCKRGVMGHDWYLYEVEKWTGTPKLCPEEAKEIKWVSLDELKNIKLEKVWKYWFKKLGYI